MAVDFSKLETFDRSRRRRTRLSSRNLDPSIPPQGDPERKSRGDRCDSPSPSPASAQLADQRSACTTREALQRAVHTTSGAQQRALRTGTALAPDARSWLT